MSAIEEGRAISAPRFHTTYCSQCGGEFGPGDHGFSDCRDHAPKETAYERMTNMFTRKAEQCITVHGFMGRFQGLTDSAQRALDRGDIETLRGLVRDMAQHSEASAEVMKSWK